MNFRSTAELTQSTFDFTTYPNSSLEEAFHNINQFRFPENHAAVCAEIQRRKAAGTWWPQLGMNRPLSLGSSGELGIEPYRPVFLVPWLAGWLFITVLMAITIFSRHPNPNFYAELAWFLLALVPPGVMLCSLFLRETLEVFPTGLRLRILFRQFPLRSHWFQFENLRGIRTTTYWSKGCRSGWHRRNAIELMGIAKNIRFAHQIGALEAERLLAWLEERAHTQGLSFPRAPHFEAPRPLR